MLKFFSEHTKLKNILLCILSGILLGLSFPPFKTWFLAYFGLLILLYLVLTSEKFKQAFGRGYLALLVFNGITLYWISGWHSNDTFLKIAGLATVLVHPVFMSIPVMVTYSIKRNLNKYYAIFLFPFIWTGFEYFHELWQFAFPWLQLGNTETYNLNRIQYIEYIGVHGTSFLICAVSSAIYFTAERIFNRKWNLYEGKTIATFLIILIILVFPDFYSTHRLDSKNNERYYKTGNPDKEVRVCTTQANTDPYKKWGLYYMDTLIDSYFAILDKSLKSNPDLILLHETAPPYYFFEDYNREKTTKFIDFVNINKKYLLMGIPHLEYYPDPNTAPNDARATKSGKKYDAFNSVILLEPGKQTNEYQIHKKVKLVPFSERVPYQEIVPFAEKLVNWGVGISHWQKGSELNLFELKNSELKPRAKFEAIICFESVFSEYVSEGIKKGAEFIAIVTNDGWWGNTSGPYQHEQYAVLRAIENRKWVIRCAQTGVSCYIDPLGNIYDEIPYNTEGISERTIIANDEITFYAKYGDIAGKTGLWISAASLFISIVLYLKRK